MIELEITYYLSRSPYSCVLEAARSLAVEHKNLGANVLIPAFTDPDGETHPEWTICIHSGTSTEWGRIIEIHRGPDTFRWQYAIRDYLPPGYVLCRSPGHSAHGFGGGSGAVHVERRATCPGWPL